jgi:peptidoglycan hydrolase CwlO-like protein
MSNAALVLGVAGVAVVGVGLAMSYQKAEAEKGISTLAPGAVAPNIPTHTTAPTTEQQNANLLQLLSSYRSDLARLQSERLSVEMEMQQAEAAGARACDAYALEPEFAYRCNGFPVCGFNEWYELTGQRVNPIVQGQCKAAVTGVGSLGERTIEMRGEHNRARWDNLLGLIRQGQAQAQAAAVRYQQAKAQVREIDRQIAEVQKKIADLNARGVY